MAENSFLTTVNPLLGPPGGLFFSSTFEEGLIETGGEGGLKEREVYFIFSEKHQREHGFTRTDLWFPGVTLLFLTIRINGNNSPKITRA